MFKFCCDFKNPSSWGKRRKEKRREKDTSKSDEEHLAGDDLSGGEENLLVVPVGMLLDEDVANAVVVAHPQGLDSHNVL